MQSRYDHLPRIDDLCSIWLTIYLANMTTYIPALTLPSAVFANGPVSILLPIVAGTAVGYSTRRMLLPIYIGPR